MLKKFSFTLLIISFVLISCAKKSDNSSSSTTTTTTTTYPTSTSGVTANGSMTIGNYSASGTYASICNDASNISAKPSDASKFSFILIVTGSRSFTREVNYYTDTACTALSLGWYFNNDNVTDQGPYSSGGLDQKVSYNQNNQTFLASTTAGETYIEDLFGSGLDVTIGTKYESSSDNTTYYNLVKVDGSTGSSDHLYFGTEDPTAYPSTSGSGYYVKQ